MKLFSHQSIIILKRIIIFYLIQNLLLISNQKVKQLSNIDQSNLSNYGNKSLGYGYTEKDIYNKQNKNFNIISLKPNQYN